MAGAVLNTVNVRLNVFLLVHSSTAVVMVNQEYFSLAEEALKIWAEKSKGYYKSPLLNVVGDSYMQHSRSL